MDPLLLVANELKDIKDRLDRLENLAKLHTIRFNLAEGMAKENTVRIAGLERREPTEGCLTPGGKFYKEKP